MDSIIIRDATLSDTPEIARVQVDTWRTTYRGIVPDEHLSGLTYEHAEGRWRKVIGSRDNGGSTILSVAVGEVADSGDESVIGFVCGGRERTGRYEFTGELYALYLLKEFQSRGIGRMLFHDFAQKLSSADHSSMLLWVLAENPSRKFYEAMGGEFIDRKTIEIGGVDLEEVAYGWKDLTEIIHSSGER